MTSTTSTKPSTKRAAAASSSCKPVSYASRLNSDARTWKLTCPGVSIMLIRCDLPFVFCNTSDIGEHLSDIPLDCDRTCGSVYRSRLSVFHSTLWVS